MLKGIDISRYQEKLNKDFILSQDFVIMKATEGNKLKDKCLDQFYDLINGSKDGKPNKEKLYGFYHYARPEKNDAITEAKFFLEKVGHHAGNALFALDWEGTALKYPYSWALEWLDLIYENTGVRPLIYTSASETKNKNIRMISDNNYGLWVAHWGVNKPKFYNWPVYALWQYKVDMEMNVDLDYFNGTRDQFKKYCARC